MSLESPLTFVRSIKGAPASVLLALLFTRRPMTNQELQRWTGYSGDTVTQAVRLLDDLGWITAVGARGPWTVVHGRQLPLMEDPNPEFSASSPSSSSLVESQTSQVKQEEIEETSHDAEKQPAHFADSLHALYDAGIREPTAGQLARLPHVDPEFIAAHVELSNAQGHSLGTAIYRIRHGWPVPRHQPVSRVEDQIRRFLGGGQAADEVAPKPRRRARRGRASKDKIQDGHSPRTTCHDLPGKSNRTDEH